LSEFSVELIPLVGTEEVRKGDGLAWFLFVVGEGIGLGEAVACCLGVPCDSECAGIMCALCVNYIALFESCVEFVAVCE
jgi:hypothetical protein